MSIDDLRVRAEESNQKKTDELRLVQNELTELQKERQTELKQEIANVRHDLENQINCERGKRIALEKELAVLQERMKTGLEHVTASFELKLNTKIEETNAAIRSLDEDNYRKKIELLNERCDILSQERQITEEKLSKSCVQKVDELKLYLHEKYPTNEDVKGALEILQSDINEKAEWLERSERNLLNRIEVEANASRQEAKRIDVHVENEVKRLDEVQNQTKERVNGLEKIEQVQNDTQGLVAVLKKQVKDLWNQADTIRTDHNKFCEEQKMVVGFLDTQQKAKFGLLQKDIQNLLTLYGSSGIA